MELSKNKSTDVIFKSHSSQNDYDQQTSMISKRDSDFSPKKSKILPKLFVLCLSACLILLVLLVLTFYKLVSTKNKLELTLRQVEAEKSHPPSFRAFVPHEKPKIECDTNECYNAADFMRDHMNQTVKPCNDYYQFTCGKWLKEKSDDEDQFTMANDKMLMDLSDILNAPIEPQVDSEMVQAFKKFYQACMNSTEIEERADKDFFVYMKNEFGKWPLVENSKSDKLNLELYSAKLTSFRLPLFFRFISDLINNTKIQLQIRFVEDYCKHQNNFMKIYQDQSEFSKLLKKLKEFANEALGIKENNVLDFDEQINEMLQVAYKIFYIYNENYQCGQSNEKNRKFETKTINELSSIIDPGETKLFDLNKYAEYLNENSNRKLNSNSKVVISLQTLSYLTDVFKSLRDLNYDSVKLNRAFLNLGYFHVISSQVERVKILGKPFYHVVFPLRYYYEFFEYEKKIGFYNPLQNIHMIEVNKRERPCALSVLEVFHIPDTDEQKEIQSLYLTKKFDIKIKNKTHGMFNELLATSIEVIRGQKWIDEKTKSSIEERFGKLEYKLVYTDTVFEKRPSSRLKNFYNLTSCFIVNKLDARKDVYTREFDLTEILQTKRLRNKMYMVDIFETNLLYFKEHNVFMMPAAVLIEPIFNLNNPVYLNYATIGSYMAHEMFHLIDEELKQASPVTHDYYINTLECLKQNYINYVQVNHGLSINGTNSVAEQIADTFGLLISYKTYLKEVEASNGEIDLKLPGLSYTTSELFFIRYSQSYCRKRKWLRYEGLHPIHSYRSSQVSFIPEFSNVFKCGNNNNNIFLSNNNLKQCKIFDI